MVCKQYIELELLSAYYTAIKVNDIDAQQLIRSLQSNASLSRIRFNTESITGLKFGENSNLIITISFLAQVTRPSPLILMRQ